MTRHLTLARAAKPALAALAVLFAATIQPLAQDYILGPMDKVRIRVSEWQAAEATVREWPSMTGDFIVGPSGTISLPFVGALEAAGHTAEEVSTTIEEALQQKLGLLTRPDASVELAEFRPVFITGDVSAPGRYPYEPELTVLKAISLAGGIRRAASEGMRIERDYINASGNRRVLEAERDRLEARRARLLAEAEGAEQVDLPEALAQSPAGKALVAREVAFMAARKESYERQLSNLDDLKQLLSSEISSLDKKLASQKQQIDLSREELKGIGGLADKGLVVNERVRGIERSVAEMEGKALDMETAQLRARQDMNKAERDIATLSDDRDADIARDLQETEAQLEQLDLKIAMFSDLMTEAVDLEPTAAIANSGSETAISYRIVRKKGEESAEIAADENATVNPGDVIKVAIVPPKTQ